MESCLSYESYVIYLCASHVYESCDVWVICHIFVCVSCVWVMSCVLFPASCLVRTCHRVALPKTPWRPAGLYQKPISAVLNKCVHIGCGHPVLISVKYGSPYQSHTTWPFVRICGSFFISEKKHVSSMSHVSTNAGLGSLRCLTQDLCVPWVIFREGLFCSGIETHGVYESCDVWVMWCMIISHVPYESCRACILACLWTIGDESCLLMSHVSCLLMSHVSCLLMSHVLLAYLLAYKQ
jgi:hypothetical protein